MAAINRSPNSGATRDSSQGDSPCNSSRVTEMIDEFRDVQFTSAAQKTTILRAWVRFLKSGLQFEQFTRALYEHLIQHCSFIAHYNRAGFYSRYFEAGDSTALFLSQFDARGRCLSVEYGDCRWRSGDYEDINRAMIAEGEPIIPLLIEIAHRRQKTTDIAAAIALLAKHGISSDAVEQMGNATPPATEAPKRSQELLPYS